MGGSLGRALKALPSPPHVRALSADPSELNEGVEAGVLDQIARGSGELLKDLDLLVYTTPLEVTLNLLGVHRPFLEPDTVVTDVVSLKVPLLARMVELDLEKHYVGSHPMAGGEGSGFGASRAELFRGARVWMVRGEAPRGIFRGVRDFWVGLGARPEPIGAETHDRLMAWVSHLPQLTANALALALENAGFRRDQLGSGGLDMTRLAASNPEMWKDLFRAAPEEASTALKKLEEALADLRELLERGRADQIGTRMASTRNWTEKSR